MALSSKDMHMTVIRSLLLLAGLGLSFAAGLGVGHRADGPRPTETTAACPSNDEVVQAPRTPPRFVVPRVMPALLGPSASEDDLWASLTAGAPVSDRPFERLVERARNDPATLRALFRRFESEQDPNKRLLLKSLLSRVANPEVLSFSLRLAGSGDPRMRLEGFDLLHRQASDAPEVRALVKRSLSEERDPQVLAQAVGALHPTAVGPEETREVVGLLRGLTQNPDPMVRRQTIMTLAQWDRSGEVAGSLNQALTDEVPEVRQAAIWATAEAGVRTDGMKAALLATVRNENEKPEIRASAVQALSRFPLTGPEYASYDEVRSQLSGM
jgi:hypothetical protein